MMDPVKIASLVIAIVLVYGFFMGVTWQLYSEHARKSLSVDNWPILHLGALIWPLVLPMLIGIRVVARLTEQRSSFPRATAKKV